MKNTGSESLWANVQKCAAIFQAYFAIYLSHRQLLFYIYDLIYTYMIIRAVRIRKKGATSHQNSNILPKQSEH